MTDVVSIVIVASDGFSILPAKIGELQSTRGDAAPEHSVLHPGWRDAHCDRRDGRLFVNRFLWQGLYSGLTFDLLRDVVLPAFQGSADLVLTWGDGAVTGLRLVNHKVTEHEVEGGRLFRVVPTGSGSFPSQAASAGPQRVRRGSTG